MLTNFTPREPDHIIEFWLHFTRIAAPSSGYSFECNELGAPLNSAHAERAEELRADPAFMAPVIIRSERTYHHPARGRCACGRTVILDGYYENPCECGRAYNPSGQEIEPNYGRAEALADGENWDEDI